MPKVLVVQSENWRDQFSHWRHEPKDLSAYNITESNSVKLEFEGNITVEGEIITGSRNLQGEIILIRFKTVP
jgi:hypothetical protein